GPLPRARRGLVDGIPPRGPPRIASAPRALDDTLRCEMTSLPLLGLDPGPLPKEPGTLGPQRRRPWADLGRIALRNVRPAVRRAAITLADPAELKWQTFVLFLDELPGRAGDS